MRKQVRSVVVILVVLVLLLAACGPTPEPEVIEKEVTKVVTEQIIETVVETVIVEGTSEVVEKVVTATPEPEAVPAAGGTLVIASAEEPDTLDIQRSGLLATSNVMQYVGGTLMAKDPETGEFVPYLAESWTISPDGLQWDFKLREDVTFHDGTPLTAQEYAWTLQRAVSPELISPSTGPILGTVTGVEAVDDYTLRITQAVPNYTLFEALTTPLFQPLLPSYVEEMGDSYGQQPMGVGPYQVKEWVRGDRIILERYPDFAWGPPFAHEGPAYVEQIEFRFIPEVATIIAGLETGEIDLAGLQAKDVERIRETGQFQILEGLPQGTALLLYMNLSRPPFDDLLVRQALNLAIDRETLVRIVSQGQALPAWGPLTPATPGYWPGVEYIGYGFDLPKARSLLAEAGYIPGEDDMLVKDGQPLSIRIATTQGQTEVQIAQLLHEMFGAAGIAVDIDLLEFGTLVGQAVAGEYDTTIVRNVWHDHTILYGLFHSSMVGAMNYSFLSDPDLDQLLVQMAFTTDTEASYEKAHEVQRILVEQAYVAPLFTPQLRSALSNRIQGVTVSPINYQTNLWDAYIETAVP
jgi:peptide/nickel transport system substrate-binding protein